MSGLVGLRFLDVEPVWRQHLWPGRRSAITAFNQIPYLGGFDPKIAPRHVDFWGWREGTALAAVGSGYATSAADFRVRGLYVFPPFRGQGLAARLLERLAQSARAQGCRHLWSAPRATALGFYLRAGFRQTSALTERDFEFGPNCFVRRLTFHSDTSTNL